MSGKVKYKTIPGFPDYKAGTDGNIWSKRGSTGKYRIPNSVISNIKKELKGTKLSMRQIAKRNKVSGEFVRKIRMGTTRNVEWKKVEAWKNIHGKRFQIYLCNNKGQYVKRVSRLILETFVGPCPEGMECCHNNGNPEDNRLENLRWDTRSNNHLDKIKHGTMPHEACISQGKLTEKQIKQIRKTIEPLPPGSCKRALTPERRKRAKLIIKFAEQFNVSRDTIYSVVNRKHWNHIP